MNTIKPLQCQQEAARFASTTTTLDRLRSDTVRAALDHILHGDRAAALRTMYTGLAAQAPLTFKAPTDAAA